MSDQFVQKASGTGTTTAVATLNGVVAGNTIVAFAWVGSNFAPTVHSVADVPNGAYAAGASASDSGNNVFAQAFTLQNASAGTHTITFTSDVGAAVDIYVVECQGPTSGAVTGTNALFNASPGPGADAIVSGTVTIAAANTLVGMASDTQNVTPGNEPAAGGSPVVFTSRDNGVSTNIGAWRLETGATSTTAGGTWTATVAADRHIALVVAIANAGNVSIDIAPAHIVISGRDITLAAPSPPVPVAGDFTQFPKNPLQSYARGYQ